MDDVKIQILKKSGIIIGVFAVSAYMSYKIVGKYMKEK
jgi:hypothetical protein